MSDPDGLFPLPFTIRQFRIAFYLVIAGYVGYLLVTAMEFRPDDKVFPYLVGVPTLLIALAHTALLLSPELESRLVPETEGTESLLPGQLAEEDVGRSSAGRQKYGLLMLLWVSVLPLLIFYLGFAYVLPPYIFAFVWFFRRNVKLAAITSVGFSIGAYVLFIAVLQMIPWEGELGLPSLIGMLPFG